MSAAEQIEHEQIIWTAGYAAGLAQGRAEVSCQHVHPQIAASVAEMFGPWDGAENALQRSVTRFHNEQRQEVTV